SMGTWDGVTVAGLNALIGISRSRRRGWGRRAPSPGGRRSSGKSVWSDGSALEARRNQPTQLPACHRPETGAVQTGAAEQADGTAEYRVEESCLDQEPDRGLAERRDLREQ